MGLDGIVVVHEKEWKIGGKPVDFMDPIPSSSSLFKKNLLKVARA